MENSKEASHKAGEEGQGQEKTQTHQIATGSQPTELPFDHMADSTSKDSLANEPLRPALEALAELDRKDPKLAFQAARILGLYRRMWESCVSKHVDCQEQARTNQSLEKARLHLANEREKLQHRHDEQLSHLRFFEHAFHVSRERLTGIISDWKHSFISEAVWLDGAKPE
ncbi:hypothetical protein N7540_013069 [Penicillium herquei]|nr:hypothetical protein N7540_013069 [Penicillium herquei]